MEHRTCNADRCAHCGAAPPGFKSTPRPITPTDLAWYFGEAAAAMGVRSTHGAFVDMAMSGIQGGGKTNGVEARSVEEHRLLAVARHRCLHVRLGPLTAAQLAILEALYGLGGWTVAPELSQVRATLQAALRELVNVAPMTPTALAHAARRQAHPSPRKAKDRPSQPRRGGSPSEAARALLAADPALAGSPRGAVIAAVAREDPTELQAILREAEALAQEARRAAGVGTLQPSRRVRGVTHPTGQRRPHEAAPARPRLPSEALRG